MTDRINGRLSKNYLFYNFSEDVVSKIHRSVNPTQARFLPSEALRHSGYPRLRLLWQNSQSLLKETGATYCSEGGKV